MEMEREGERKNRGRGKIVGVVKEEKWERKKETK